jgi:hypothetical protein
MSLPRRTDPYDAAPANVLKRLNAIKHLRLRFNEQIIRWSPELPVVMKRIIVCCDGTWNADDLQTNDTNVVTAIYSLD